MRVMVEDPGVKEAARVRIGWMAVMAAVLEMAGFRREAGASSGPRRVNGRFNDGFDEVRMERARLRRLRKRARPQGAP